MRKLLLISFSIILTVIFCDIFLWHSLYSNNFSKPDLVNNLTGSYYDFRSDYKQLIDHPETYSDNINILFIGDSFVRAFPLPEVDTIPFLLEKQLKSIHPKINVFNAGVTGANSVDNYHVLKNALNKMTPQLVIYFHNNNDEHFSEFNLDKHTVCSQFDKQEKSISYYLSRFSNIAYYFYHRHEVKNIYEPVIHSRYLQCSFDYIKKSQHLLKSIPHIFIHHRASFKKEKYCNEPKSVIKNDNSFLRSNLNINSISLADALFEEGCDKFYKYYDKDDYHYNRQGNQKIAKSLSKKILANKLFSHALNLKRRN